jgi:hypothetical protein
MYIRSKISKQRHKREGFIMHKFFTSSYDASIYLQQPDQNAGRDEILEVGKLYYGTSKDIARSLLKFDITQISSSIIENNITSSYKIYLNLKSANSEEIPLEYTIYANAVSQIWTMGTGTKFDNISTDGVSWYYKDGSSKWQDLSGSYSVGEDTDSINNGGGGTWYLSGSASQSFNYEHDDIRMDITNMVSLWISGSLPNNGLIVHHGVTNESDDLDYGVLKFFSKETNTIYEPKLELVWNDQSFTTGSLTPVTGSVSDDDYKVVLQNLKNEYPQNQKVKIRVKGRDMFPLKSFGTTFAYDQTKYLPITTYYQLEDYKTGEVIFPFGEYTKVSCDSTSNYFLMDLSTLPINRTYVLKLKIVENGISTIIDDKLIFEII